MAISTTDCESSARDCRRIKALTAFLSKQDRYNIESLNYDEPILRSATMGEILKAIEEVSKIRRVPGFKNILKMMGKQDNIFMGQSPPWKSFESVYWDSNFKSYEVLNPTSYLFSNQLETFLVIIGRTNSYCVMCVRGLMGDEEADYVLFSVNKAGTGYEIRAMRNLPEQPYIPRRTYRQILTPSQIVEIANHKDYETLPPESPKYKAYYKIARSF